MSKSYIPSLRAAVWSTRTVRIGYLSPFWFVHIPWCTTWDSTATFRGCINTRNCSWWCWNLGSSTIGGQLCLPRSLTSTVIANRGKTFFCRTLISSHLVRKQGTRIRAPKATDSHVSSLFITFGEGTDGWWFSLFTEGNGFHDWDCWFWKHLWEPRSMSSSDIARMSIISSIPYIFRLWWSHGRNLSSFCAKSDLVLTGIVNRKAAPRGKFVLNALLTIQGWSWMLSKKLGTELTSVVFHCRPSWFAMSLSNPSPKEMAHRCNPNVPLVRVEHNFFYYLLPFKGPVYL